MPKKTQPAPSRFWLKVERRGECWEWMAAKDTRGNGLFNDGHKTVYAHRFVWMLTYGDIPEGMCVTQACDNDSCVRPDHLELVTRGQVVSSWAQHKPPNHKLTPEIVAEMRRLKRETPSLSCSELAESYGVSESAVRLAVTGRTWKLVGEPPVSIEASPRPYTVPSQAELEAMLSKKNPSRLGRATPNHRLTEDQVLEMRELRLAGWKNKDLAKKYGVAVSTISNACTGATWTHVAFPGRDTFSEVLDE